MVATTASGSPSLLKVMKVLHQLKSTFNILGFPNLNFRDDRVERLHYTFWIQSSILIDHEEEGQSIDASRPSPVSSDMFPLIFTCRYSSWAALALERLRCEHLYCEFARAGHSIVSSRSWMKNIPLCSSAYKARDTERLGQTLDIEHSHVRFLGNTVLNLWDCGGQQNLFASYLDGRQKQVFGAAMVLIFVFDLVGEDNWQKDMRSYKECLAALQLNSPSAQVFCLLHKMDLVEAPRREGIYTSRVDELRKTSQGHGFHIECFGTSIMDETIYQAWSKILQVLIPNLHELERRLDRFAELASAEEVVIFDHATFLVICKSAPKTSIEGSVLHPSRFGKISKQVKELRSSCQKVQSTFQSVELRAGPNNGYSVYLDVLTRGTYIMVISAQAKVELSAIKLNVQLARESFEHALSPSLETGK
jgi:Ras-related GTP-binding protein A/B